MASNQITWPNAYWPLVGLALNTMIQRSGSVCGWDRSLEVYLKSSPCICAADTIAILIRFGLYRYEAGRTGSIAIAAKQVLQSRHYYLNARRPEQSTECPLFVRVFAAIASIGWAIAKLLNTKRIPLTQVWAIFYLAHYGVVSIMIYLSNEKEELAPADEDIELHQLDNEEQTLPPAPADEHIELHRLENEKPPLPQLDMILRHVAIVFQLGVLSFVDFARVPPQMDPIFIRYTSHLLRFSCLLISGAIHFCCDAVEDVDKARIAFRRLRSFGSTLLILGLAFATLVAFDRKFTIFYFLYAIATPIIAWVLFWNPTTLGLVCPGGREGTYPYEHVVVFDLFCKIFSLSLFWYSNCYSPEGTSEANWAQLFG
jgi:hypothetical protein